MAEKQAPESTSASRQKSCNACVKAKRGCDKRHPLCSRCDEKSISCSYTKRTYADAFENFFHFDSAELDMSWAVFNQPSSSIQSFDDIPPSPATSTRVDTTPFLTLDASTDPYFTFAENQATSLSGMQLVNNAGGQRGVQPEKEQALSKFDYTQMADICVCYSFKELKGIPQLIPNLDTI